MKEHPDKAQKQSGAALAIGLILLLVSTLVAVSAMQGTRFQERMASNHYNKAISFNAAEVGATRLVQALNANDFEIEQWASDLDFPSGDAAPASVIEDGIGWGWYWAEVDETVDLEDGEFPVTIFGVSRRPEQWNDPRANLALTQLDVRVGVTVTPPGGGGPNDAGINLVGKVNSFEVPDSNALEVCNIADTTKCTNQASDEEKVPVGPAVGTLLSGDAEAIENALEGKNRLDNYRGNPPVTAIDYADLWVNPAAMQEFVAAACIAAGPRCTGGSVPSNTVVNKNASHSPNLTVIGGAGTTQLDFRGGRRGEGILIVEGTLRTRGTPQWDGLIIVLGGQFHITGGGNGGINGALYTLNLDMTKDPWEQKKDAGGNEVGVTFKSDGGGNAKFNHNCDVILDAVNLLGFKDPNDPHAQDQAGDLFGDAHGCDPAGGVGPSTAGFTEYSIVTWTEVLR